MNRKEEKIIAARILDWAAPGFPLEIRDLAARVYTDYIQQTHSDDIDHFSHELKFGTGGMRGLIGPGAGRINRWTVGKVTLGFCRYLQRTHKKPSIVIAHDSRRFSLEFAKTTAGIAAGEGLNVFLFTGVTPTPILSYAIRKLKASGGVVITASHNPPDYNGYKVYFNDGAQLVGAMQKELEHTINLIKDWSSIIFLDDDNPVFKKRVKEIGPEIKQAYIQEFQNCPFISSNKNRHKKELKIVYTPLHGTGGTWLSDLLSEYGFKVHRVESQWEPDGEFPTLRYPNPEEPEAFAEALEKAKAIDADLILATDPDADRLGAGVKKSFGNYFLLSGNQIGSIMCAYLCENLSKFKIKEKGKNGQKRQWHIFKTIVTTNLQKRIADENGICITNVLTGFKYIAERMRLMEEKNKKTGTRNLRDVYLFGGEESFGYLPVDFVRDKDGLASALLLAEIAANVGNLIDYLNQISLKYGLYLEDLKSVTMKGSVGKKKIQEIMDSLRNSDLLGWKLGHRKVVSLLDFQTQSRDGKKSPADFSGLPESNVIQLILKPEGILTIRPSGTEPRVKLYASLRYAGNPTSLEELEIGKKDLADELASISGTFFARSGMTG